MSPNTLAIAIYVYKTKNRIRIRQMCDFLKFIVTQYIYMYGSNCDKKTESKVRMKAL